MASFLSNGVIPVPAHGTPVKLNSTALNVRKLRLSPGHVSGAAWAQNAGNVYIGTSVMNRATLAGVYRVILKTDSPAIEDIIPGDVIDLSTIFVDCDTDGDGVIVGYQL